MNNLINSFAIRENRRIFAIPKMNADVSRCREVAFHVLLHRDFILTTPGRSVETPAEACIHALGNPVVWFFNTLNMNALTFDYNGQTITFDKGDSVMVNATEMARPFTKQPKDWLRLQSTKELITSLSAVRQISLTGLILVNQGGSNQGTWMHEDVALEFARWLSPQFAIWCNDRIKELLTMGMTATPVTLEAMLANPDLVIGLATQLKELRRSNEALVVNNKALTAENLALAPKARYADEVLQSASNLTFTEVAKELGYRSAKTCMA